MTSYQVEDIRNVVFVGHGAVGKTTLADLILFKAGISSRVGSVDDGTSLLDTDDDEKHHKHTISSSVSHFEHAGKHINLIDTPGYPDFVGGALGSLRAAETAAVVISATSGIEVNARKMFRHARNAEIGRFVIINKCDADNIDFPELISSIQETFGSECIPMNVPVGLGTDFSGVVNTLTVPDDVPENVVMDPKEVNQSLMDAIVEADEELMERYLEGEEISQDELSGGLHKAISSGTLIPIFCVSAKTQVGIEALMDGIANYALSPADLPRKVMDKEGQEIDLVADPEGPLVAQVYKVKIDPFIGKISFLKIFSGTLSKDSAVHRTGASKSIKIHQLFEMQGKEHETVDKAIAGSIVAIPKVDDLQVGDMVTVDAETHKLPPILFPTPMIGLAIEPKTQSDQQKISSALHKIVEEDPTFIIRRNDQTKEMVMQGISELHLQLSRERLLNRDKVDIITHQPKVPYREAVNASAEGHYRHKKQSGGSGQFAEVHLRIAPIPRDIDPEEYFTKKRFESMRKYHYDPDLNFAFIDRVTGGSVPNNFIPAVEKGVRQRMAQGVIAGNQVQDVSCELFFGKDHPVDSNETAFKMAASLCFRNVFKDAKPVLLEPIVHLEITVPGDKLGDVTSDLSSRRGQMEGMDGAPGGFQVVKAHAPLAEVMTYARALSSMTGGQGSFSMELSHYEIVPPNEQAKIIAAAEHPEEEDEG